MFDTAQLQPSAEQIEKKLAAEQAAHDTAQAYAPQQAQAALAQKGQGLSPSTPPRSVVDIANKRAQESFAKGAKHARIAQLLTKHPAFHEYLELAALMNEVGL